jgi:hypothetical protein
MDLDKDGVKVLKNIFSMQDIETFRNIYFASWNQIKNNLKWNTINYKPTCNKYDNFIGIDLYSEKYYCKYIIVNIRILLL